MNEKYNDTLKFYKQTRSEAKAVFAKFIDKKMKKLKNQDLAK